MAKVNPFEFVNAINYSKENLFETKGYQEKDYTPFLINRAFSYYEDTVLIANEANKVLGQVPNKVHFQYYLKLVDRKRRFARWEKELITPKINVIMQYLNYTREKAIQVEDLFSDEDIQRILDSSRAGGSTKDSKAEKVPASKFLL